MQAEKEILRMQPICVTPEEAGAALGIGRTFVYELLATGKLESIKLGRRRLIPREALERLVAEERERQFEDKGG